MESELTAPRHLSEEETMSLRKVLKAQLSISSEDDEVDADDLLDYAMDMIEGGETVGHVAHELQFMEMPVCDEGNAQLVGVHLTTFLHQLRREGEGSQTSSSAEEEEKSSKEQTIMLQEEEERRKQEQQRLEMERLLEAEQLERDMAEQEEAKLAAAAEEEQQQQAEEEDLLPPMEEKLKAPRELTEDEIATLREILRAQLMITSEEDEADAEDLLDYALNMIEGDETVGYVALELQFMDMPICDVDASQKVGAHLTKFFHDLDSGGGSPGEEEEEKEHLVREILEESERMEQENAEAERLAAEEQAKAEAERLEQERLAAEEQAKAEAELLEQERLAEKEKLLAAAEEEARQKAENQARLDAERLEKEQRLAAEEEVAQDEAEATPTMDADLTAPRELSDDEMANLRAYLKAQLNIQSEDDEVEAEDLAEFVVDMIEGGESIGHVVEELALMEMSVCDEEAAHKLGVCLTFFLTELDGGESEEDPLAAEEAAREAELQRERERIEEERRQKKAAAQEAARMKREAEEKAKQEADRLENEARLAELRARDAAAAKLKEQREKERLARAERRAAQQRAREEAAAKSNAESPETADTSEATQGKGWISELELRHNSLSSKQTGPKSPAELSNASKSSAAEYQSQIESLEHDLTTSFEPASNNARIQPKKVNGALKDRMAAYKSSTSSRADHDAPAKSLGNAAPTLSLKERMASFKQNSSSNSNYTPFVPPARKIVASNPPEESSSSNNETEKGPSVQSEDAPDSSRNIARLTLKERMAAYKEGGSSTANFKKDRLGSENMPIMSLKDRMAAYKGGGAGVAEDQPQTDDTSASTQEDPIEEKDTSKMSLKERMAAYKAQGSSSKKATQTQPAKDINLQKGKEGKNPRKESKLHDRMAAFQKMKPVEQPKKRQSALQERMAKFAEQKDTEEIVEKKIYRKPKVLPKEAVGGGLKDRMAKFKEAAAPGAELDSFAVQKKSKAKAKKKLHAPKKVGGALQQRMAAFQNTPDESSDTNQKQLPEVGISSRGRVGNIKGRYQEKEVIPSGAPETKAKQSEELKQGMSTADSETKEGHSAKEENPVVEPSASETNETQITEVNEVEPPGDASDEKNPPEENSALPKESGGDLKQRLSAYQANAVTPDAPVEKKQIKAGGNDLQQRMAAFKDATSPDAFQKKKLEDGNMSSSPVPLNESGGGLQERLSKFVEVSAADAFQKKKLEEESSLPIPVLPDNAGGDLKDRLSKFVEVSAADAFLKKKVEEGSYSPGHSNGKGSDLQNRMAKFKEITSPDAFKKKKEGEIEEGFDEADGPIQYDERGEIIGGPGNNVYMGKVVENKITLRTTTEASDYVYLYKLYLQLEKLKAQMHDSPHFEDVMVEMDVSNGYAKGEEEGVKNALEGILASTQYTANVNWLNKEWIEKHLIRDDEYGSIKFRFRDHMLFKQFDKTAQKGRDKVIRTFVEQLLQHANDITQLDLSSCLLPDKFLEVLAEEVLKNPANSLPKLQLINFESNLLEGRGIEALSEVIKNDSTWRFLQAILLENQRNHMTGEAERALADAVNLSPSIVVCSASIRDLYAVKDITDAILFNMDQLRLARRDHQAKEGTLKDRERNETELYFDSIASNESTETEVELVGDHSFVRLDDEEKAKSGAAFKDNTSVRTIKMEVLGLDDNFAIAFGESIANNSTIEKVNIDSNAITGFGMKALFAGLGKNNTIDEFQVRHQKKPMATLDEEALPDLLAPNTALLKLGIDVRSQLVRMQLDKIINANRDRVRKERLKSKK